MDILEEAVLGGDGEVADVVDALHFTRGVKEHDEMGIAAATGEFLLGLAPGERLLAGHTAVDGHREVAVGKHVVERPLAFIDGGHALGDAEIGIVPSEGGMPDDVAELEGGQCERGVTVKRHRELGAGELERLALAGRGLGKRRAIEIEGLDEGNLGLEVLGAGNECERQERDKE